MDIDDDELHGKRASFQLHRSSGEMLLRKMQYTEALSSLAMAIECEPSDVPTRALRVETLLALGDSDSALEEANRVLQIEQTSGVDRPYRGVLLKADVLYARGSFEQALKFYYQGSRIRPSVENFDQGIAKCLESLKGIAPPNGKRPTPSRSEIAIEGSYRRCMPELAVDIAYLEDLRNSSAFANDKNINNVFHEHLNRNNHNHPSNAHIRVKRPPKRKKVKEEEVSSKGIASKADWTEEDLQQLMQGTLPIGKRVQKRRMSVSSSDAAAKERQRLRAQPLSASSKVSEKKNAKMIDVLDESITFFEARRQFWMHNDPSLAFPSNPPSHTTFRIGAKAAPKVVQRVPVDSRLLRTTTSAQQRASAIAGDMGCEDPESVYQIPRVIPVGNKTPAQLRAHLETLVPRPPPASPQGYPKGDYQPVFSENTTANQVRSLNINPSSLEMRWSQYNNPGSSAPCSTSAREMVMSTVDSSLAYEMEVRDRTASPAVNSAGSFYAVEKKLGESDHRAPTGHHGNPKAPPAGSSSRASSKLRFNRKSVSGPMPRKPSTQSERPQQRAEQRPSRVMQLDRWQDDDDDVRSTTSTVATVEEGGGRMQPTRRSVGERGLANAIEKDIGALGVLLEGNDTSSALELLARLVKEVGSMSSIDGTPSDNILGRLYLIQGEVFSAMSEWALARRSLSSAVHHATVANDHSVKGSAAALLATVYSRGSSDVLECATIEQTEPAKGDNDDTEDIEPTHAFNDSFSTSSSDSEA